LKRIFPDPLIPMMLAAVALALLLPVEGSAAAIVSFATTALIVALFFLHGARLPREALTAGLLHWRLHLAILATTYAVFPLIGLGLASAMPGLLPAALWTGVLFLCALPSTVQSSIAFTSLAGGNVAGAVAAAAFSNLLGVLLTPLLIGLLLAAQGEGVSLGGVGRIAAMLLLPFVVGHLLRGILLRHLERAPALPRIVDRATILIAVYGAFSAATVEGLWSRVSPAVLAALLGTCIVLLALVLLIATVMGRRFDPPDRAAILFCGSVKSLVSGIPMARILFPGPAAGLVILPVMLFHALQLIVCAWIAARLGAQKAPRADNA
jgi:solute carrier family 10 (sodium/bile acid cotransporter), member 7